VWNMISGMWFSSFVFLPVGIWLTYKAVTDSSIMLTETYTNLLKKVLPESLLKKFLKDENPSADE
jgi:lipopolysaccharide export system permease protein